MKFLLDICVAFAPRLLVKSEADWLVPQTLETFLHEGGKKKSEEQGRLRAVAYCRVSTLSEEQELSYESQCDYFRQMIEAREDLEFVGVYGDHEGIVSRKVWDTYYIHLYIDRKQQLLIIKACDENDKDGQCWCIEKNGDRKSRKITSKLFAEKLYKMMGWSKGFYYKVCGTPAQQMDDEDELLFVFELKEFERYALSAKSHKAAGVTDEELNEEGSLILSCSKTFHDYPET